MPDQNALNSSLQNMQEEMRDMRSMMGKMAEALTKLSVLEERNLTSNQAIEKVVARQDKQEERLSSVILEQARFEATVSGISSTMKVMWAAFGTGVVYIGGQVIQHYVK